jgi:hypothetical protein
MSDTETEADIELDRVKLRNLCWPEVDDVIHAYRQIQADAEHSGDYTVVIEDLPHNAHCDTDEECEQKNHRIECFHFINNEFRLVFCLCPLVPNYDFAEIFMDIGYWFRDTNVVGLYARKHGESYYVCLEWESGSDNEN